jgi:hypothetical protein
MPSPSRFLEPASHLTLDNDLLVQGPRRLEFEEKQSYNKNMSIEVSRIDHREWVFVLTEDDLSKLHQVIKNYADSIEYEIECSDGLARKLTDIKKLYEYENPPDQEIKSLTIRASAQDHSLFMNIEFRNSEYNNVHIYLIGSEKAVTKINRAIEERLIGMRPWYARFATIDFSSMALAVAPVLVVIVALILILLTNNKPSSDFDPKPFAVATIFFMAFMAAIIAGGWILDHLRRHLFPKAVFAIGQGAKRHAHKEWLRRTIITAFIGLLLTSFASLFWSLIRLLLAL